MRWFSAAIVVVAFLFLSACSSLRENNDQFVCADTCDRTLGRAVFWCSTIANLNTLNRPKVELAYRSCLAEYGYVDRQILASRRAAESLQQEPVQQEPVLSKPRQVPAKKKPKRSAVKKKPKKKVQKKKAPAKARKSRPVPPQPEEFDPQDLFEDQSDSNSS